MTPLEKRPALFDSASRADWDVLIIGGGITGAGILKEAVTLGLRAILVEQRDFAWGTSSRSSKLVHGGLRYLKQGQFKLTRDSVRERQRLLNEAPGLVEPMGFLLPTYKNVSPGSAVMTAGLTLYDLLAMTWSHRSFSAEEFRMLAPRLAAEDLEGGFRYGDAQTDDARLVFRLIQEAVHAGGVAFNDASVEELILQDGKVSGAAVRDRLTGVVYKLSARAVINATGAWADRLRSNATEGPRLRPLRGSHLVFPAWRIPLAQAVGFSHPRDLRPVFLFPWEGVTLAGTTDVDHPASIDEEPSIAESEVDYIFEALASRFPTASLSRADVLCTFSGVRPVLASGQADPSKESRDHAVWEEAGLVTVTGGKLTTFRLIAQDALKAASKHLGKKLTWNDRIKVFESPKPSDLDGTSLDGRARRRLFGRHGNEARNLILMTPGAEHLSVEGTPVLWAELRWAARHEAVHHLDDLLLRRTRLGLLLPGGGAGLLERIEPICRAELGWSKGTWEAERERYAGIYQQSYSLPGSHGKIAETKVESKLSADTRETRIERAVPA